MKNCKAKRLQELPEQRVVNIAGMTATYFYQSGGQYAGMTQMLFLFPGGQHHRNDPKYMPGKRGVNITRNNKIIIANRVVSITGMSGQHDRNGWSGWIGLYKSLDYTKFQLVKDSVRCRTFIITA